MYLRDIWCEVTHTVLAGPWTAFELRATSAQASPVNLAWKPLGLGLVPAQTW